MLVSKIMKTWRIIPQPCRYWWTNTTNEFTCFNGEAIDFPFAIFVDKLLGIEVLNEDVDRKILSRPIYGCNWHQIISIFSPWV